MASGVFESSYAGKCKECGAVYRRGSLIRYNDESQIIGQDCCGDQYEYWEAYVEPFHASRRRRRVSATARYMRGNRK